MWGPITFETRHLPFAVLSDSESDCPRQLLAMRDVACVVHERELDRG